MIGRKLVRINAVSSVVLDEADEMLNMGFKEDIDEILNNVPKKKYGCFQQPCQKK